MPQSQFTGSDLRRIVVAAFLVAVVLIPGLAGCGDAESVESEVAESEAVEEEKPKKKRKERSTSVNVAPVVRGDLVLPVIAEGSIRARNTASLKFEATGRITEVHVREGQRVRKGQEIVSLDDRDVQLALEEARSRYLQGLGQLAVEEEGYSGKKAEQTLNDQTSELALMETDGLITRQERLDRELELGMAAVRNGAYRRELLEVRSGLAKARADMTRLNLDLERTVVRAPFSGVITELNLSPGESIQAGGIVSRLVDDTHIEADVGVLESDLGHISLGGPAFLQIPSLEELISVKVDVISPDIDQDSRTCSVLMRLRSGKKVVRPGMFVRASIAGKTFTDRLLVPVEAILTRDGRPVLFRVEDGRAKWVYVQLGAA